MGDNDEEGENFTWVNGKFRVFSGDGEIMDVLLQNRDDDGENTGEFETATEQDIFFEHFLLLLLSLLSLLQLFLFSCFCFCDDRY